MGLIELSLYDRLRRLKANQADVANLEGEGRTTETVKGNADAIATLETTVDTNRLYSDSQYLALKAKYDAQQIALNASKAELYTDDPILQYGAVEIIGDGYEADDTPIDVSANVVDGSLSMEQKGLTITNGVTNGSFEIDANSDGKADGLYTAADTGSTFIMDSTKKVHGLYSQKVTNTTGLLTRTGRIFTGLDPTHKYFFFGWCAKSDIADDAGLRIGNNSVNYSSTYLGQTLISANEFQFASAIVTPTTGEVNLTVLSPADSVISFWLDGFGYYDLTALGLDHITDTDILAKLLPYVDGTKSVGKMGIQILDADDVVTQTIFLPAIGNSLPSGVADSIKTVADGWEHTKRVSTPASVASGVAVNTTNYPTAKNAGQWVNELTTGGTGIGVVGTDSTTGAGMLRFELATPVVTHYDLPLPTSGKTIHRFAGEEKIALYGTGLTFSENVLTVLSAVKFVSGVMTDITSLATITGATVTFSGVSATDVVYAQVEHDVDRPLGILEHTPAVSNTASRLASLEARVSALGV